MLTKLNEKKKKREKSNTHFQKSKTVLFVRTTEKKIQKKLKGFKRSRSILKFWGPMLTKPKNIRKKIKKNVFSMQKKV